MAFSFGVRVAFILQGICGRVGHFALQAELGVPGSYSPTLKKELNMAPALAAPRQ
jgi:hypothetical protein